MQYFGRNQTGEGSQMEPVPKVRLHDILTRPPTVAYLQHNVEFLKSSNYVVKLENIVWFKELSLTHLS
jgi:hypothetical protein